MHNDPAISSPIEESPPGASPTGATSARGRFLLPGARLAILLDAGFVSKRLQARLKRPATAEDFALECRRIRAHADLADLGLLRTFVYDAPPADGVVVNPLDRSRINLARTPIYRFRRALHDSLELMPDFALRRGELALHGWRLRDRALSEIARSGRPLRSDDVEPFLEQKGVDLRMGLDIAALALRRIVDTIVVVSGDSDLVPALKFARREGLRVYLDHLGGPIRRELRVHVDVVL